MSNYKTDEELQEIAAKIQDAAMHTVGDNIVPRELSFKQAIAIYFRSERIQRENLAHPIDNTQKRKEIDFCWRLKAEGRV